MGPNVMSAITHPLLTALVSGGSAAGGTRSPPPQAGARVRRLQASRERGP
jgi:hypothetical protein